MSNTTHPTAGRIAFVTGGNRGLGRTIVDELLTRSAGKVYATSRSEFTHPDPRVVPVVLDVTDRASVAAAAEQASDVDLLVNNAGLFSPGTVLQDDEADVRRDLEANLFGLINVSRAFAPILGQHEQSSLLNVLSAVSWVSLYGGYGISKSAALSATNGIRQELAGQGTTVSALHVGYMDTDMARDLDVPKTDPATIARLAINGVELGDWEILADDAAKQIKAGLSGDLRNLYPEIAGATAA